MSIKKKLKKLGGVGMQMTSLGIGTGIGIQTMGGLGLTGTAGTAIGHAQAGVGKIAGSMGTIGSIAATGTSLSILNEAIPHTTRRRRKRH